MKPYKYAFLFFLSVNVFCCFSSCKKEAVLAPPSLQKEYSDTTSTADSGSPGLRIEVEGFTVADSDSIKVQMWVSGDSVIK